MTVGVKKIFGHGSDVPDKEVGEDADGQGEKQPVLLGNFEPEF